MYTIPLRIAAAAVLALAATTGVVVAVSLFAAFVGEAFFALGWWHVFMVAVPVVGLLAGLVISRS